MEGWGIFTRTGGKPELGEGGGVAFKMGGMANF